MENVLGGLESLRWFFFFLALLPMSAMADCSGKISREPRPLWCEPNMSVRMLPISTSSQGVHVPACRMEKREKIDKDKVIIQ